MKNSRGRFGLSAAKPVKSRRRRRRLTGLLPGTAVAVGLVDAHVAAPAVGITDAGQMLMILGTSTCHMLLGREEIPVPGICGVVEDGVLPGFFAYEAGQKLRRRPL